MKEVYEIVTADKLRAGDVIKEHARDWLMTVAIINAEERCVQVNYGPPFGFKTQVFRQLPLERNPDVLMRALEIAVDAFNALNVITQHGHVPATDQRCIDKAIRELESEAGR